jgi:hypothetical protein
MVPAFMRSTGVLINCALVVRAIGAMLQTKKKMALFGLKDCPAQDTQKWLSKCYF